MPVVTDGEASRGSVKRDLCRAVPSWSSNWAASPARIYGAFYGAVRKPTPKLSFDAKAAKVAGSAGGG